MHIRSERGNLDENTSLVLIRVCFARVIGFQHFLCKIADPHHKII
jgi:hypothetical protein